ncbi:hypothetical protein GGTG_04956 [Gaeumannomyces tritici R3-111a-1]|uniref:Uncharacterized protein n=1 Tax=Gaeumannomyces tritici (strain R3-111a-1) TaxID=644352 RepID=J3NUK0_GAET3|nr:hypothetical protein GGTG_04956 [Gaeumannomyces tritici R3-111a-1]EJT79873.1 hypothetical protein GGTG_04956 [Gaeumannomyces tritici R3-111a-1]
MKTEGGAWVAQGSGATVVAPVVSAQEAAPASHVRGRSNKCYDDLAAGAKTRPATEPAVEEQGYAQEGSLTPSPADIDAAECGPLGPKSCVGHRARYFPAALAESAGAAGTTTTTSTTKTTERRAGHWKRFSTIVIPLQSVKSYFKDAAAAARKAETREELEKLLVAKYNQRVDELSRAAYAMSDIAWDKDKALPRRARGAADWAGRCPSLERFAELFYEGILAAEKDRESVEVAPKPEVFSESTRFSQHPPSSPPDWDERVEETRKGYAWTRNIRELDDDEPLSGRATPPQHIFRSPPDTTTAPDPKSAPSSSVMSISDPATRTPDSPSPSRDAGLGTRATRGPATGEETRAAAAAHAYPKDAAASCSTASTHVRPGKAAGPPATPPASADAAVATAAEGTVGDVASRRRPAGDDDAGANRKRRRSEGAASEHQDDGSARPPRKRQVPGDGRLEDRSK